MNLKKKIKKLETILKNTYMAASISRNEKEFLNNLGF